MPKRVAVERSHSDETARRRARGAGSKKCDLMPDFCQIEKIYLAGGFQIAGDDVTVMHFSVSLQARSAAH